MRVCVCVYVCVFINGKTDISYTSMYVYNMCEVERESTY